jgi:acyl-CoA dehydrogenase
MFDSSVERLFADLCTAEAVLACESGAWPKEMWQAVEESGFTLALAPEALGGAGASWADVCGVLRLAGRHNLPLPLVETMLANWLLGRAGIAPMSGPVTIAASNSLVLRDGKITGKVADVPWGRHATALVAITADPTPNVVVLPLKDADISKAGNIAGEPRDTLAFAGAVPLSTAPLAQDAGEADLLMLGGAMVRAAQIAGALESVLAMATGYAGERVQFGKAIGSFQAIQHQVAVLAEHTAAAVMAAEAASAESSASLAHLPVMAAKINASDAAGIGARVAHAVHGAIGFTQEHALHLSTRRLWSWRSEFGSSTEWAQQLGRALCGAGAASLWPSITASRLPATNIIHHSAQEACQA